MNYLISELSIFFPAYNEGRAITDTVKKAKKVLEKIAREWEIIIIDDGSNDNTGIIAKEIADKDKNIRLITHTQNRGYGAAFKSGFYNAQYPWIAFTDADGQFDFSEITRLIEAQEKTGSDLIIGYYLNRKVSLSRKINTFLWEMIVFILFGLKVRDIDCGFKLVSKRVIDKIPRLESERGAFISSEFLIKAKKAGFKINEVGVHHYPRIYGTETGANLNVIINSFVDLSKLWKKLK